MGVLGRRIRLAALLAGLVVPLAACEPAKEQQRPTTTRVVDQATLRANGCC